MKLAIRQERLHLFFRCIRCTPGVIAGTDTPSMVVGIPTLIAGLRWLAACRDLFLAKGVRSYRFYTRFTHTSSTTESQSEVAPGRVLCKVNQSDVVDFLRGGLQPLLTQQIRPKLIV